MLKKILAKPIPRLSIGIAYKLAYFHFCNYSNTCAKTKLEFFSSSIRSNNSSTENGEWGPRWYLGRPGAITAMTDGGDGGRLQQVMIE